MAANASMLTSNCSMLVVTVNTDFALDKKGPRVPCHNYAEK